jgi:hypothetical protein
VDVDLAPSEVLLLGGLCHVHLLDLLLGRLLFRWRCLGHYSLLVSLEFECGLRHDFLLPLFKALLLLEVKLVESIAPIFLGETDNSTTIWLDGDKLRFEAAFLHTLYTVLLFRLHFQLFDFIDLVVVLLFKYSLIQELALDVFVDIVLLDVFEIFHRLNLVQFLLPNEPLVLLLSVLLHLLVHSLG